MARKRPPSDDDPKTVRDCRHDEAKRKNNPEVGLSEYEHAVCEHRRYEYDPHLSPILVWAGKAERQSFEDLTTLLRMHKCVSRAAPCLLLVEVTNVLHRRVMVGQIITED